MSSTKACNRVFIKKKKNNIKEKKNSYDYLCENYRMIFASEKKTTKRRTMIESIQSLKS
jgi:hypothetical protein